MGHSQFMQLAIENASKNNHKFGAILVKDDKVISFGSNRPPGDPRWHAETTAIIEATNKLKTLDLSDCTLYATGEPCPMCFYMAWVVKIPLIVYGATVQDSIDAGIPEINISVKELNKKGGRQIKLVTEVLRKKCVQLLNKK